jgi:hypothetical protein
MIVGDILLSFKCLMIFFADFLGDSRIFASLDLLDLLDLQNFANKSNKSEFISQFRWIIVDFRQDLAYKGKLPGF